MRLYHGSFYIVGSREFITWVMTDSGAQNFINWTRDTFAPEETIWATLYRAPGAPYGQLDDFTQIKNEPRVMKWYYDEIRKNPSVEPCFEGAKVHGICVMGIGDFEWIKQTQLKDQR